MAPTSGSGADEQADDYLSRPVPPLAIPNIRPDVLNPIYGLPAQRGPDYLDYNVAGRGWFERMVYNVGTLYLAGAILGGSFGFVEGLRTAPSTKFNIRLNSVLNKSGKRGARVGNALGSVGFLYSCVEGIAENTQLDRVTGHDWVLPVSSALLTGVIYKSTAGVKTVALAGALGASLAATSYAVKNAFPGVGFRKGLLFF